MRRVGQKRILEVDDRGLRLPDSFGDCMSACLASIFELPLDAFPPRDDSQWLYDWLSLNFPGTSHVTRYYGKRQEEPEWHRGFWIAAIESPRFKQNCTDCSSDRETSDPKMGLWRRDECPWCDGTGLAPGWHAIVMENRERVWDPHPGVDWDAPISYVGETVFVITDPSRLVARPLPTFYQAAAA